MRSTPKRHEDSTLERKEPCPDCGGTKSLGVYSDGHTYCFKCGTRKDGDADSGGDEGPAVSSAVGEGSAFLEGKYVPLAKRRLSLDTCKRWGILTIPGKGRAFNYRNDHGGLVGQKVKNVDAEGKKLFYSVGTIKTHMLYGKGLWAAGGNRIAVVEGEDDAPALDQALSKKYPVVSVPTGAKGAYECLKANLEYLLTFKEIILGLDNDKEGKDATEECVRLFPPGRVKLMQYGDLKDASDFLQHDRVGDLVNVYWRAETYRPEGIIKIASIAHLVRKRAEMGLPWPYQCMTDMTYGRRLGEMYGFGAGTGIGKTDLFLEVLKHTAVEQDQKCGTLFMEQAPEETIKRVGGKLIGKRLHVPNHDATDAELERAEGLLLKAPVEIHDSFGSTDWEPVKNSVRYLVLGEGCQHIFLDHLTVFCGTGDDNTVLHNVMADLAGMAKELRFCLYFVSHLATPVGTPHEEGGRVAMRHFRGSRAIGFWTHYAFGLERNPQADDPEHKLMTRLRCVKDRMSGDANGATAWFKYNRALGRLEEGAEGYNIDAPSGRNARSLQGDDFGF